ncbi:MAG: hypothetical protein QM831_13495 [Kofleriaceae bacterium]
MVEFVDLATAKAHPGVRVVVQGMAPSPWSEAVKGMFRLAGIPIVCVRQMPGDKELTAWAGVDNAPVVFHKREPPRTSSQAIVGLVARLFPAIVPSDVAARAEAMGLVEMIAGEDGLGWNGRLAMIHAGLAGTGGFPAPVAGYLAKRYGYSPETHAATELRVKAQLDHLASKLHGEYFGGAQPNAVDVYLATFLNPIIGLTQDDCPNAQPMIIAGFGAAAAAYGEMVPASLLEVRKRMYAKHLAWPISI